MPEMPEVQAHAERLDADYAGRMLRRFEPLSFTALKTAVPAPDAAYDKRLERVSRRGKYLLLEFQSVTFAVHLMQGGRLRPDAKQARKPRGGQARFVFDDGSALLLTEAGTERKAGVWALQPDTALEIAPLGDLGPEANELDGEQLAELLHYTNQRLHGFLRDQRLIAGLGRRLANEICHRAKLSPFALTGALGTDHARQIVKAINAIVADDLEVERQRDEMSSSADRPSAVHHRAGQRCPVCGDEVRAVEYRSYTINYCPTCQTDGKLLADNTTSRFLK